MRPSGLVSRAVLLTLVWAGSLPAQQPVYDLRNSWTSPCTLDVVLVTFKDTTGVWLTYSRSCNNGRARCDYDTHDLPHGYSRRASDGALMPGTTSNQLEDFERLFGTDGAMGFVDTDVTVADGTEELPEVRWPPTATDAEGDAVVRSLVAGAFTLDEERGVLRLGNPPDFGAPADADTNNIYHIRLPDGG